MNEAVAILREIVAIDPWEHSREGMDDHCHFCGSDWAPWMNVPGRPTWESRARHLHHRRCAWIRACALLGEPVLDGHFTLDTKPDWLDAPAWFLCEEAIETTGVDPMKELS